jgi:hypothetical protein
LETGPLPPLTLLKEQETIERWIIEFDEDKSGTISQDEFCQALIGLLKVRDAVKKGRGERGEW